MNTCSYSTSDIISHLPRELIGYILTFLPIRDAVWTSILSRSWRSQWENLSQVDELVFVLSRNCIKEFTLQIGKGECTNLSKVSDCFDLKDKMYIDYIQAVLLALGDMPRRLSTGLNNLKFLKLSEFSFTEKNKVSCLLHLIEIAPNLQKLVIEVSKRNDTSGMESALEIIEKHKNNGFPFKKFEEVFVKNMNGLRSEIEFLGLFTVQNSSCMRQDFQDYEYRVYKSSRYVVPYSVKLVRLITINNNIGFYDESGNWRDRNLSPSTRLHWASICLCISWKKCYLLDLPNYSRDGSRCIDEKHNKVRFLM